VLLISIVILNSCSESEELIANTSFKISTGDIYPDFNPEVKDYHITSLNTVNIIEVTINDFNPSKKCYINNVRITNKVTSLKLNPGDDIVVKLSDNPENTYTVHYMPENIPEINVITKNNPSDGYILINLFELTQASKDYSYIAILNNDGFPVYYKKSLPV
jgi:arylsulfate sulfotransferase